jgi:hypothetical protein
VRFSQVGLFAAMIGTQACSSFGVGDERHIVVAPSCAEPAPFRNRYDPKGKGYIVIFHDGTDARAETHRLADTYRFALRHVFTGRSLQGFSAEMSPSALAAVRCDKKVEYVEFNLSVSIAAGRAT